MREILLDPEDQHILSANRWHFNNGGYAVRNCPGNSRHRRPCVALLHRLVIGAPPGAAVDHINGNKLDNRKCNLRLATHTENMLNRGKYKNNRAGYKGVTYRAERRKYRASVVIGKKQSFLGYFTRAEDAARAYDLAALHMHGEFAHINFPEDLSPI